jgi:tripartite-type tricarboxylate transporter receptor subunit TctC
MRARDLRINSTVRQARLPTLQTLAIVATAALFAAPASAQDAVADFFRGRQLTMIVGSSPGGGYDIYARLIARHLPRHIPGNPTVVVSNMVGAASNAAAAHIYNVAPKDGTVIGALQTAAVLDPLFGDPGRMKHDASKFIYLGSADIDYYICIARSDAPVKSFQELLTRELIIGASQPGTSTRDFPALLDSMTGAKMRIVSGYPGTREITVAIEKGEVQGLCGFSWSSLQAQRPDWLKTGFIRLIVQEHDKGHAALNRMGVPLAVDFAKSPANRAIMELIYSSETFGRPYVMPPGVPAERVTALRRAFLAALRDQELAADAAKIGLEVDPISGEELQALAERIYATPAAVVEQARQAVSYKAP